MLFLISRLWFWSVIPGFKSHQGHRLCRRRCINVALACWLFPSAWAHSHPWSLFNAFSLLSWQTEKWNECISFLSLQWRCVEAESSQELSASALSTLSAIISTWGCTGGSWDISLLCTVSPLIEQVPGFLRWASHISWGRVPGTQFWFFVVPRLTLLVSWPSGFRRCLGEDLVLLWRKASLHSQRTLCWDIRPRR